MTILVTGGCGFIGSNFIRNHFARSKERIINLDKLTYAATPINFPNNDYKFYFGDIGDIELVNAILYHEEPRIIYNFAAESHVDNSILNPKPFITTNVAGTASLLYCVKEYSPKTRFVHVSTDEVFGSLSETDPPFNVESRYNPRSPYAASKASSDHFVKAYFHTHKLDTIITNCSNNYGPYQHPEKFIPTIIRKALRNEQIPVYGSGSNIRDWIYVMDHCEAIKTAGENGISGSQYLFGGDNQVRNIDLTKKILNILKLPESLISYVDDRKGHDHRYDIDNKLSKALLGWEPIVNFDDGLRKTVLWYKNNMEWVEQCLKRRSA